MAPEYRDSFDRMRCRQGMWGVHRMQGALVQLAGGMHMSQTGPLFFTGYPVGAPAGMGSQARTA
jgi:hypothetical protein